jgi:hypothetical protein
VNGGIDESETGAETEQVWQPIVVDCVHWPLTQQIMATGKGAAYGKGFGNTRAAPAVE